MKNILRLTLILLVLAAPACRKRATAPPRPQDPDQALAEALSDVEARRYGQAEDRLTFLIFNFPGSRQASDAQYHLADCYFQSKDYEQAQTEFDFYLKSFPNGRYQEEASYKLALAHLRSAPSQAKDQTRALKARELIDDFIESYPESRLRPQAEALRGEIEDRLAMKEFEAALLYYKSGEFKSALVYYEYIRANHPAAGWAGVDRYRLAVCFMETGRSKEARAEFEGLIAGDYPPALKERARKNLSRIQ